MPYYLGAECPYCGKAVSAEDELAVCPVCGTPHHRACYLEHSACFNAALHKDGFEWKKPSLPESQESVSCPRCGGNMPAGSAFCNYCGSALDPAPGGLASRFPASSGGSSGSTQTQARRGIFFNIEPPADYKPDELIDGIPASDWAAYIGSNSGYYIGNFKFQDRTGRKTSFTLSAVIFPFIYFLYRKVWGAAAISAALNLIFNIPYLISTVFIPFGIDFGFSAAAVENVLNYFSAAGYAANLCWGLFAVWIYRKNVSRRIGRIKADSVSESQYRESLTSCSGPSRSAVFIACGAIFAAAFIGSVILTLNRII